MSSRSLGIVQQQPDVRQSLVHMVAERLATGVLVLSPAGHKDDKPVEDNL